MAVGELDRVLNVFAVILLANLLGFLLHKTSEGVEVAGDTLSSFFLGRDQSVVEALDLFALCLIDAVQREVRG